MDAVTGLVLVVCASDDGTWASMGALVVGFRYRRSAGVGVSSRRGGMRSSVKGTAGSMEMIDLVRKSSGVIIGVVMLDSDFAAYRSALREAVRFDLKADLRGGAATSMNESCSSSRVGWLKTRKSNSSTSISGTDNG